jgi:hypothetical protein
MKRLLAAAILMLMTAGMSAAQDAPPMSPAQLQKILKFIDTIGAKEEFPPPTAQNLGVSTDPNQTLPVTVVVTDDHKVYFCRSDLNPADYIIWVRVADTDGSYLFLTHADLKLTRTVHLQSAAFPEVLDVPSAQIRAIYKDALLALGKDVSRQSAH